ncbi:SCO family protein [Flavobacterium supellecticarium]|uniref:SCO family protein n=1 Tax=Flavobacterium supellecticarium TaxID=2565924 RepID=A0A4S3ZS35_9FLAO|nr:SCO family protein [Flavobacterium supellecticarium]THF48453.1 SCO family protein [Flavobacterium supellecticarium]
MEKLVGSILLGLVLLSCTNRQQRLPFLGNPVVKGQDTLYPKIKNFTFIDQDSITVTNKTFDGKIYIADFIFLSCPTICPKMTVEMLAVYHKYQNNPDVAFLSHTIDPEQDTIKRLKAYSENLGITGKWHFVTGNKENIYKMATESYFMTAYPDAKEPGGYVHSGGLLLIDRNRHIRGVYDGTNPQETKRLIADIALLLKEK